MVMPKPEDHQDMILDSAGDTSLDAVNDPKFQQMIMGGDLPDNPAGTIEPGENRLGEGLSPEEEVAPDAEGERIPEEETPEEVDIDELSPKTVKAGSGEEAEINRQELSDDDLDNMFMTRKINGVEELVSLREVRDGYQIKEAGLERLDEAKEMQRQYHDLILKMQQQTTQPQVAPEYDDYSTPEDRQLAEMRNELNSMKEHITNTEAERLSSAEDAMIRSRIKAHFGNEDLAAATHLIQRVKSEDPAYGAIADALFNDLPTNQTHMNQRVAFMDSLLIKAKSLEMPTIISKAKEEGRLDEKREKKSNLASVDTTQKVPEESRSSLISKAAQRGDKGMAELGKELFIKGMFPEA
jgi:hypothetical protein